MTFYCRSTTKTKEVTKSITDPECGLMNRPGKPIGFHYLDHQTCDSKNGMITDVFVTPGNVRDCTPHTDRIEYQIDKFGFQPDAICADAGYDSGEIHSAMLKKNIKTYIPKVSASKANANYEQGFDKNDFKYNEENDLFICPNGKEFRYSSYKKGKGAEVYRPKQKDCIGCPFRSQCMGKSKSMRTIEVQLHEKA